MKKIFYNFYFLILFNQLNSAEMQAAKEPVYKNIGFASEVSSKELSDKKFMKIMGELQEANNINELGWRSLKKIGIVIGIQLSILLFIECYKISR